ncbi:hypothetical protein [Nocardioides mangrovicus]|nr:hypothetical protein [Nocardioides mangrovicus]
MVFSGIAVVVVVVVVGLALRVDRRRPRASIDEAAVREGRRTALNRAESVMPRHNQAPPGMGGL